MDKKSIGILTFHRPINIGAALQAVATFQYLRQSGFNPEIIDYRQKYAEKCRKLVGGRWTNKKSVLGNLKSVFKDFIDLPIEKKRQVAFNGFVQEHVSLSSKCSTAEQVAQIAQKYDVLLVGSDLVWNWEMETAFDDVFFLNFPTREKCKKMSYSSSVGSSHIPEVYKARYQGLLKNFDCISVREKSTKEILDSMVEQKVQCTVDPTLLLKKNDWEQFERTVKVPGKYILIYLLQQTEEASEIVNEVVRTYNLPVIYYSKKPKKFGTVHCENAYEYGPDAFLYLIHHAEFVVTNSFHGTVFSVIYEKPFVTIPHTTRGARMIDFLNEIEMQDHCVSNKALLDIEKCKKGIPASGECKLNSWIKNSESYLINSVES